MLSLGGRYRRRGGPSRIAAASRFNVTTNNTRGNHGYQLMTIIRLVAELFAIVSFLVLAPRLIIRGARNTTENQLQQQHQQEKSSQQSSQASAGGAYGDLDAQSKAIDAAVDTAAATSTIHVPHPRSILLIGLVKDLRYLDENRTAASTPSGGILTSMEQLCRLYAQPAVADASERTNARQGVGIWITYAEDDGNDAMIDDIKERLNRIGCVDVVLEKEPPLQTDDDINKKNNGRDIRRKDYSISRYDRLARLRSEQRQRVIRKYGDDAGTSNTASRYDVVVNIDLDLLSLPELDEFVTAVEAVSSSSPSSEGTDTGGGVVGNNKYSRIVCANGYETWFNPRSGPRLFYDTLPAIDKEGRWYYQEYSRNWFQVLTLGQRRLYNAIKSFSAFDQNGGDHDIVGSSNYYKLWPMKACFGGAAMYGWELFSSSRCDYVRSRISLPGQNNMNDGKAASAQNGTISTTTWQFPEKYTLSGTKDGDACEHAVFQLCLAEEYRQRNEGSSNNDNGALVVGIQPGLIVSRDANIMSTDEAVWGLFKGFLLCLGFCVALKLGVDRRNKARGKDI